jgi:hypothetical protein
MLTPTEPPTRSLGCDRTGLTPEPALPSRVRKAIAPAKARARQIAAISQTSASVACRRKYWALAVMCAVTPFWFPPRRNGVAHPRLTL